MAAEVYLHSADQQTIDVMASPIVQDTSSPPDYIWLGTTPLNTYGNIGQRTGTQLPYQKSIAYKARILDEISHHDNTSQYVGDLSCITSPNAATCAGRGPFEINGSLYYIDYTFFYVVNEGDASAYSPIISVDTSRCDSYYGFILGSPKLSAGATADAGGNLVASAPKYANFLNTLNTSTTYIWTAVDATNTNLESVATPQDIVTVTHSAIDNGQYPVTMKDASDNPITLTGQALGGTDYFQPFILLRYIHESAPTKRINITVSVSYHV